MESNHKLTFLYIKKKLEEEGEGKEGRIRCRMNLGEGIKLPETECQTVHQSETSVFWDNFVYTRYCLKGACAPKEERKKSKNKN